MTNIPEQRANLVSLSLDASGTAIHERIDQLAAQGDSTLLFDLVDLTVRLCAIAERIKLLFPVPDHELDEDDSVPQSEGSTDDFFPSLHPEQ